MVILLFVMSVDNIPDPNMGVCGEQFIEAIGTQDIEFIEYVGVIGDIALVDVDMLLTSGYNFCASIFYYYYCTKKLV